MAQSEATDQNIPCSPERSSDPWKPAWRSSRRSRARQQRLRPVVVHNVISFMLVPHLHPDQHGKSQGGSGSTYHSELVERSGLLDVLQRLLEVLQLEVDLLLGGLGILDGLNLEGLDGLELAGEIVGRGLELLEALLDLVDNGLVLQDTAVVGEVDGGGLLAEDLDLAAGVLVALLESLEGGDRLATQAEGRGHFSPVELEGGASLFGERGKISS